MRNRAFYIWSFVLVLGCLSPSTVLCDTEPNDTTLDASPIVIGASTAGSVNGSSDSADWYRVEVPDNGELAVTVTHEPSDFQFILYGRQDDFEILGTETNAPSGRRLVRSVQAGTYHIQVNSRNNPEPVGYAIMVSLEAAATSTGDVENNDTPESASSLFLNFDETGHISHTRDDRSIDNLDYYRFYLPGDADVGFTFTHDPPERPFQFRLLRFDGISEIHASETNFPSGETRTLSLGEGTYYLEVNGRGETKGRTYRINVSTVVAPAVTADSESNDAPGEASSLSLDTDHVGHISHTRENGALDDLDYYRINLHSDADVSFAFTLEPPEHSFRFRVLGADGVVEIFATETNFPSGSTRGRSLAAGTYFLEVSGGGETRGRTYRFNVSTAVPASVTTDTEPNDNLEGAALLSLDAEHIGHISHTRDTGVVDDLDYYLFSLPVETEVNFTFSHAPAGHPFQFRVLDAEGETTEFETETEFPSGQSRTHPLAAGNHYLVVSGRESTEGRSYFFSAGTNQTGNRAPTALIGIEKMTAAVPFEVRFDAGGSLDTDGDIVSYLWEVSDGRGSGEKVFSLVFDEQGEYSVRLTVTDDGGLTHTAEEHFRLKEAGMVNEATLSRDLVLSIPRLRYDAESGIPVVASVVLKAEGTDPPVIFKVKDVVTIRETDPEENEATLTTDLNLHIPFIRYDSSLGEVLLSADMKINSVIGDYLFEVTAAEIISP